MERLLLVILVTLALACCGGAPQSPYDGDCSGSTCNGHIMSGGSGGGSGGGGGGM